MTERIYEMLWDCEFCATRKLLGKTHRYCPNCGAPQNPEKRYFPSDADKIEAKDHEYHGADRLCLSCKTANAAKTRFCVACGGAMEGAASVPLVAGGGPTGPDKDALEAVDGLAAERKARSRAFMGKAAAGLAAAAALALIGLRLSSREVELSVAGHRWEREIAVEAFRAVRESSWCDAMPPGSYEVTRSREVRSHESVPDGQDCKTVKRDRGDGTFAESEECKTRYREEPVYDFKCQYSVDRWAQARSELKTGGFADPPSWPGVELKRTGQCQGCEREGARREKYVVRFEGGGKEFSCDQPSEAAWKAYAPDSRWKGKVNRLTGLDCRGLKAL